MKLLLDTCTFLWIVADAPELSPRARDLFQAADNEVYLSAASAWESPSSMASAACLCRTHPTASSATCATLTGSRACPSTRNRRCMCTRLPAIHRDPFDRMLVSQAIVHGLTILTPDALVTQYPGRTTW